ncbi:TIGR00366 family protein [Bacillus pumilus]|uniref:TIGR00366 family protein n=1 Tax=Bacillus TaxID=1386 RepID=UPI0010BE3A17|nr:MULTISPECIES: TIGR00366 family protein [Bacillus]MBR0591817.1 TIGR00366 family protein [Bacillus pumilus sxm20-2]MBU8727068.1 TIGR00366 family protein [Bacillus pumilus]MCM3034476.1 TIGR00366 family protein [Bacillus pumilus]MCM3147618.1 TIGR00366 family protein [Bacillus pumilus]MCP1148654.1 TIGR00366 family protein [Bacillus sp. 1735sda2]
MSNGENMAFNIGDLLFQVFSLLFIAAIVTIIVIAFRMIRRKRMELKKVEERLNKVIEKNDLKE